MSQAQLLIKPWPIFLCVKNFFETRSSLQLWSNFSYHAICLFLQLISFRFSCGETHFERESIACNSKGIGNLSQWNMIYTF